jgi:hypothetical protein
LFVVVGDIILLVHRWRVRKSAAVISFRRVCVCVLGFCAMMFVFCGGQISMRKKHNYLCDLFVNVDIMIRNC